MRLAVLAVLGLLLVTAIAASSLTQMGMIGERPEVQVSEGWDLIKPDSKIHDYDTAEDLARTALDRNPLQSGAAALLAVIREQRGDLAGATQLMRVAGQLNHRDDIADYWLLDKQIKGSNVEEAVLHADALLRRYWELSDVVFARLLLNFNNPRVVKAVAERLAKNPSWRTSFITFAATKLQNPGAAFIIYSSLKSAGSNPSAAELRPYFERLLAAKRYDEAYLSWVLFLPENTVSKLGNIYDGGFDGWPDTRPFGWTFGSGVTGSIESASAYNGSGSAMQVSYDGMSTPKLPGQILLMSPGTYRFTGKMLAANGDSAGAVRWTIGCDDGAALLTADPVPDTRTQWRRFNFVFTVPDGCKAQTLELKPVPLGQRANIEVWFDQLAIERLAVSG